MYRVKLGIAVIFLGLTQFGFHAEAIREAAPSDVVDLKSAGQANDIKPTAGCFFVAYRCAVGCAPRTAFGDFDECMHDCISSWGCGGYPSF